MTTGEGDNNGGVGGTARSYSSSSSSEDNNDDDELRDDATVVRVTDRDVLCGRGMGIRRHPGNVLYKGLLRASYEAYKLAPKGAKAKIVERIVEYVREGQQQPGGGGEKGRFLERRPRGDRWISLDIGHERAILKTAQALRDIKATSGRNRSRYRSDQGGELFRGMTGAAIDHRTAPGEAASVGDDDDPPLRRSPPRRPTFRERIAMLQRRESRGGESDSGEDSESGGDTDDDGMSGDDDDDDDVSDTETEDSFSMYESPIKR